MDSRVCCGSERVGGFNVGDVGDYGIRTVFLVALLVHMCGTRVLSITVLLEAGAGKMIVFATILACVSHCWTHLPTVACMGFSTIEAGLVIVVTA